MLPLFFRLPAVLGAVLVCFSLSGAAARADADVILTISVGPAGAQSVTFDRDDLEQMPQLTYRTSTIWTNGVLEFRGVALSEVLKAAGMSGRRLVLRASNDYAAELPMTGVTDDAPIIALTIDGKRMSLRDKGPLWVVYPYDLSTIYQTEVVYTRSVWQLERIEVLP